MTDKPPIVKAPKAVPVRQYRKPESNLPQTRPERERLRRACSKYALNNPIVPPLPTDELRDHARKIIEDLDMSFRYVDYAGVLLNNELWREQMAAVPYERRLLLLSKCMRLEERCPAPFDEFGLLCKSCGLCSIEDLQREAEKLGYAVLVAEGSTIVMKIIETGKIEAIIGVSCLSVLEKAFPFMEAAAIPGLAIPLLQSDCKDTTVDEEWVWEAIHLNSNDTTRRLDLEGIREKVRDWFTLEGLEEILGPANGPVEKHARRMLAQSGKRWRPFLTVAVAHALTPEFSKQDDYPLDLKKLAIAVECFHKASLVHDDIEDDDDTRYGEPTLHKEIGVPGAINVGDFMVGEGYRIIASTEVEPVSRAAMITLAAEGHCLLAAGQGRELEWRENPGPVVQSKILALFKDKTAPAFDVALRMGGLFAGADDTTLEAIKSYSEALGIAYQIRDDMDDFAEGAEGSDVGRDRPSLVLSLAHKATDADGKKTLKGWWAGDEAVSETHVRDVVISADVEMRMKQLKESFRQQAIDSLSPLEDASVKGLLRRVITKIFNDVEIKGWCREFEAANAAGGEAVTPAAE